MCLYGIFKLVRKYFAESLYAETVGKNIFSRRFFYPSTIRLSFLCLAAEQDMQDSAFYLVHGDAVAETPAVLDGNDVVAVDIALGL